MTSTLMRLSPDYLWGLMLPEEQQTACRAFWDSNSTRKKAAEPEVVECLRRAMSFHSDKEIIKKPPVWKSQKLCARLSEPCFHHFITSVLFEYLIARKTTMICAVLDAEGTPHRNGNISKEAKPPTVAGFVAGLERARTFFEARELLLYYGFQACGDSSAHWQHLREAFQHPAFQSLCADAIGSTTQSSPESPAREIDAPIEVSVADANIDAPIEVSVADANDDFTTLDNLLIKSVVAGVAEIEGALTHDQLEDLISQVLILNGDHHRSYFHRGFLDALLGQAFSETLSASNHSRRGWYLTGYLMGRLRGPNDAETIAFIKSQPKYWEELLREGPPHARTVLLHPMAKRFAEADEMGLLRALLQSAPLPKSPGQAPSICVVCYEKAADMVRNDRHTEALPLLRVIADKLELTTVIDPSFQAELVSLCHRKLGQAELRAGRFPQATIWLNKALENAEFTQAGNAHADLGLSAAGFRSLKFILPRKDEEVAQNETVIQALESATHHFKDAIEENNATNAHFVLGWIAMYRCHADVAEEHLSNAHEGMLEFESAYQTDYLVDWVRFLLAIVVAECCDQARLNEVRELVERAMSSPAYFPLYLWKRLCNAVAVYDDKSLLEAIIGHLLKKRGSTAYALLRESGLLLKNHDLRALYYAWFKSQSMTPKQRATELKDLLLAAINQNAFNEAAEFMDALEGVVKSDTSLIPAFVDLLRDQKDMLRAIWDELDLDFTVAALCEQTGEIEQSAAALQNIFWRSRTEGNAVMVEAVLEQLSHINLPGFDIDNLRSQVGHLVTEVDDSISIFSDGSGVRVLYVGGNETQMRYEAPIKTYLQANAPTLNVEFYFPGWDSNWGLHLDKIKRVLPTVQVVVINSLVRTQFGRELRRTCGSNGHPPWSPCTGRGKDSIQRAVLRAAAWIRSVNSV